MNKKVIVFVGMPGAGKSLAVEYLESKGYPSVYFGGIVTIDEINKRGLELTQANEKMIREDLRAKEGMGVIAKRIIIKIEKLFDEGNEVVIADGMYSWAEYKIFKEKYGEDAIIIAVAAPRYLRHERLAKRPHRPLSDTEVTDREYAEIENIEKGGPIANADYTVVNDSTTDILYKQIDKILDQIDL